MVSAAVKVVALLSLSMVDLLWVLQQVKDQRVNVLERGLIWADEVSWSINQEAGYQSLLEATACQRVNLVSLQLQTGYLLGAHRPCKITDSQVPLCPKLVMHLREGKAWVRIQCVHLREGKAWVRIQCAKCESVQELAAAAQLAEVSEDQQSRQVLARSKQLRFLMSLSVASWLMDTGLVNEAS